MGCDRLWFEMAAWPSCGQSSADRPGNTRSLPMSMGEWLDGFQRDAHPEQEVIWWERLAQCYVDFSRRKELHAQQRRRAFRVICGLALGSAVQDLKVDLAHLAPGALDEIFVIMRTVLAP
jgi:hypothetical protein